MTFAELMQDFVNTPYNNLVATARNSLNEVYPAVKSFFDGDDDYTAKFFLIAIGACVGTDGKMTTLEAQFARDVIGDSMTDDFLSQVASAYGDAESKGLVNKIVDSLDHESKVALCAFCCAFCAVDETISREECAFIAALID